MKLIYEWTAADNRCRNNSIPIDSILPSIFITFFAFALLKAID